jgi:hypothetical protein
MNLFAYTLISIGILILLAIIFLLALLIFSVVRNSFRKEYLLSEIPDKKNFTVSDTKLKASLLESKTDIINNGLENKIPELIKELYSSKEIILKRNFHFREFLNGNKKLWFIENFIPASMAVEGNTFKFAEDGMGNHYFFYMEKSGNKDTPVYFYDHETGSNINISPSTAHFLSLDKVVIK